MTDAHSPSDHPSPPAEDRSEHKQEILNAVLLGLAAILTAFAAYQTELKGGDALLSYNKAVRAINESSQLYTQGNQAYALDQSVFLEFVKAAQQKDTELAAYLRTDIASPQLQAGLDWWEEQPDDGPATPFVDENPKYKVEEWEAGDAMVAEADNLFAVGKKADDQGDEYVLSTVLLATALFLLGVAAVSRAALVRKGCLAAGALITAGSIIQMASI